MSKCNVFGVDLSKSVFHIVEVTKSGRVVKKEKLSRKGFILRLHQLPVGCELYMEACSGAHYFCRLARDLGVKARQIAPRLVKPYVGHQKNDYRDAIAICEASQRQGMRFVPNKSAAQQEIEAVHCIRQRLTGSHTALSNQLRGLLAEHGVVLNVGRKSLYSYYDEFKSDERLSGRFKEILDELYEELFALDTRIESAEQRLNLEAKSNSRVRRLTSIPGIGTLTASALEALCGDPQTFKNGRQFAAYLGLVPRQRSTGGKEKLGSITKNGDKYVRRLLYIGGLATVRAALRTNAQETNRIRWIRRLYAEKGARSTAIAIANKNARIAWKMLTSNSEKFMESSAFAA